MDAFPGDFDGWFNDHFPFRNTLINARMNLDIYGFKQSPIPSFVIIGRNNWLFNTGHEIEVYRGTNRFSDGQLKLMADKLKSRKKFIEEQGAKMLYVVTPIKYSVYPEFLPLNLKKVNSESCTDQFVKYMTQAGIPLLDLRNILLKAKNDTFPVFFKGDNHWNFNGAFVAYQEIIRRLSVLMPSAGPPLEFKDYKIARKKRLYGNLSEMLFMREGCGDYDYIYNRVSPNKTSIDTIKIYTRPKNFRFSENYEERYTNGNPHSPKILIIRDSFGYYVDQFLKENFRATVCIFDAWEYKLNPEIIKREKPDLVLFLVLESFTYTMLN